MIRSLAVFTFGELLGDGIRKLPFVLALPEAFPGARVTWVAAAGSVYAGLLGPQVAGVLAEVVEKAGPPARALRGRGPFDLVLDTQSAVLPHLALRLARRGPVSPWPWQLPRRRGEHLLAQLERRLAEAGGRPVALRPRRLAVPAAMEAAAAAALPAGPAYVAIAPGAGDRKRAWPLERYLEIAGRQAERGRVPVVLLGPAERDWAEAARAVPGVVLPQEHPAIRVAGGPEVFLTVALAARCLAGIANDAGPGHLLAAADIPLLTLFGPSEPAKARPQVTRGDVLWADAFGGSRRMEAIPVEAADTEFEALIAAAGAGRA